MRNFIETGDQPRVLFPVATASGGAVLIGPGLFGVAAGDMAAGAMGVLRTVGVYMLPKVANVPIVAGAKLYYDATARVLTTAASGNSYVAAALNTAGAADTVVMARLNGKVD